MNTVNTLPASVVDAFKLMWGNFPEPVTLVHKSREVMALNKVAEKIGWLKPGMNCAKTGEPGAHKGCLANKALELKKATHSAFTTPAGEAISFWIPLDDFPEFFVHFGVGITMDYKTGEPRAFA